MGVKIKDIGGEFALIDRVARRGGAVVGVGDDAAVLKYTKEKHLLFTTDMLCEGDHFNLLWSTPKEIGMKAMEVNVSDIGAMGGLPTYAVISLSLKPDTSVEFMDGFYEGIYKAADEYNVKVVGGDTTHAALMVVNVALLGEVEKDMLSLRSDAKVGDLICVTGDLGKSTAGLELLKAGIKGDVKAHLQPKCRLKEARKIAKYCNALIDVSDGLASEVNHICEMGRVGAVVHRDRIPVSKSTVESARKVGKDPVEYALNGGEDFELVFTVPKKRMGKIKVDCPVTVVGEILERKQGALLESNGTRRQLKGGYDHFK
ncbi:MAG: thiamine-phosphate kinase [Candidatus Altiarchaeota archaeon]